MEEILGLGKFNIIQDEAKRESENVKS